MLKELKENETHLIGGGFHLNLGTIVTSLVVGFVTGGPVGLGIAASGLVMAQGVNNINDLLNEPKGEQG